MENQNFQIRPIQNEQVIHLLSLRRVLYVKFLRWLENSSASSLMKAILKCLTAVAFLLAIMLPHFALGILTATIHLPFMSRVVVFCIVLLLTLNAKRLYLLGKRTYVRKGKGNQNTYQGIPLDNFISYLFEKKSFTTAAMSDLGLSQRKWSKIADELEHHGILKRGESNARVLGDIDRMTLVRQIRDGFPLVFDTIGKTWCERRGSFDQWVLQRERKEQKEAETRERLERKEDRMRKNIKRLQSQQSAFTSVMSLTGV